jgi:DNA (cytosine-5)-methyltransferase 1
MKLLDLFCGAGGCAMGYHQAGFDVVGVDINPQPRYPFEFIQGDALEYASKHAHKFDVIHASPPCQRFSEATPMDYRDKHPDFIRPARDLLQAIGKPYVIENVQNARRELVTPIKLCGSMFGLPIWRHRYFEVIPSVMVLTPPCNHNRTPIPATINGRFRLVDVPVLCTGGGDGKRAKRKTHRPRGKVEEIRWAMGIDWMVQTELTEAIPPVYTKWIGEQIIKITSQKQDFS